jgi:hypothetical protein
MSPVRDDLCKQPSFRGERRLPQACHLDLQPGCQDLICIERHGRRIPLEHSQADLATKSRARGRPRSPLQPERAGGYSCSARPWRGAPRCRLPQAHVPEEAAAGTPARGPSSPRDVCPGSRSEPNHVAGRHRPVQLVNPLPGAALLVVQPVPAGRPFGRKPANKWGIALVADVVAVFAILQLAGLRRLRNE